MKKKFTVYLICVIIAALVVTLINSGSFQLNPLLQTILVVGIVYGIPKLILSSDDNQEESNNNDDNSGYEEKDVQINDSETESFINDYLNSSKLDNNEIFKSRDKEISTGTNLDNVKIVDESNNDSESNDSNLFSELHRNNMIHEDMCVPFCNGLPVAGGIIGGITNGLKIKYLSVSESCLYMFKINGILKYEGIDILSLEKYEIKNISKIKWYPNRHGGFFEIKFIKGKVIGYFNFFEDYIKIFKKIIKYLVEEHNIEFEYYD